MDLDSSFHVSPLNRKQEVPANLWVDMVFKYKQFSVLSDKHQGGVAGSTFSSLSLMKVFTASLCISDTA